MGNKKEIFKENKSKNNNLWLYNKNINNVIKIFFVV